MGEGAEVDVQDHQGWTALMYATARGHEETVQALLAAGADLKAKNQEGETAHDLASKQGKTEIAELLK